MPDATASVTITNKLGMHARPAMMLVDVASKYTADIKLCKGDQAVDAKSIMQLMMLAAVSGTELRVEATGPDAADAVNALRQLVDSKFDEE
ncbi:MAG: HPr family phosphocarrier protein [Planctomycetota bacterium]